MSLVHSGLVAPAKAGVQCPMTRGYVYILASRRYGTLYVGVTSDLARRVDAHRLECVDGFTKRHRLTRLVWYETHESIVAAITREKQIKKWRRDWKVNLIQSINPRWNDLAMTLR